MQRTIVQNSKILIVDDQPENVHLLERLLKRAGYQNYQGITQPREALRHFDTYQPDLVLLDLLMPGLSGYDLLRQLRARMNEDDYRPILVLTADITAQAKQKALSLGAKDFVTKPFDTAEVLLRIYNLLETRFLYIEVNRRKDDLEEKVRERTAQLESAQKEILQRLSLAAEFRDDNTGQHTQRVGEISALIAKALGLPPDEIELIRRSAPLHDLGKIGIPDRILLKPGPLDVEEFKYIKSHAQIGAEILSGSDHPLLRMAEEIARFHHERWDGSGYLGLKGEAIPLSARIVAVADVYDVLTRERPYKPAWPEDQAIAEMRRESGRHFDPRVIDAFLQLSRTQDLLRISEALEVKQANTVCWRSQAAV